jgi:hypothetical protein
MPHSLKLSAAAARDLGVDYDSLEYWTGCLQKQLRIARCRDCGYWIHFPRRICPKCWSAEVGVEEVVGGGRLYTFAVDARATPPVMGVVELDEQQGLRVPAVILAGDVHRLTLDCRVELTWISYNDMPVPAFTPVDKGR